MEQNNVSPEKKDSILKSLAIAGFVGILLLVAWLSIQLVNLFPGALNSLASLAEGVNGYQETVLDLNPEIIPLTVTANTSLLNTGDNMTIEWSKVRSNGSYVFSYECVDGVALSHQSELGERAIDCDSNYNVGDIDSLNVSIESEKNRYADIPYTIAFLRTDDTAPRALGDNVVTVVNTGIATQFTSAATESETVALATEAEEVTSTTPEISTQPVVTPEVTPAPDTFEQEFVFTVPVSDPNGDVDLGTTFIAMGEIINGAFVTGPVSIENAGAIQFAVQNFGNKTSDDWTYSITLPTGQTYESEDQAALKPNERAVITIGFPAGANNPHAFNVEVDEPTDRNNRNDAFQQFVIFAE